MSNRRGIGKILAINRIHKSRPFKFELSDKQYNSIFSKISEHFDEYQYKTYIHPNASRLNSKTQWRKWKQYLALVAEQDKLRKENVKIMPVSISNAEFLSITGKKGDQLRASGEIKASYIDLMYRVLIHDAVASKGVETTPQIQLHFLTNNNEKFNKAQITAEEEHEKKLMKEPCFLERSFGESTGEGGEPLSSEDSKGYLGDKEEYQTVSENREKIDRFEGDEKVDQFKEDEEISSNLNNKPLKITVDVEEKAQDEIANFLKELSFVDVSNKVVLHGNAATFTSEILEAYSSLADKRYLITKEEIEIVYDLETNCEVEAFEKEKLGLLFSLKSNGLEKKHFDAFIPAIHNVFNILALAYTMQHKNYNELRLIKSICHPIVPDLKIPVVEVTLNEDIIFDDNLIYQSKFNPEDHLYSLVSSNFKRDRFLCENMNLLNEKEEGKTKLQPLFGIDGNINTQLLPSHYNKTDRKSIIDQIKQDLDIIYTEPSFANFTVITVPKTKLTDISKSKTNEINYMTTYSFGEEKLHPVLFDIFNQVNGTKQVIRKHVFPNKYKFSSRKPVILPDCMKDLVRKVILSISNKAKEVDTKIFEAPQLVDSFGVPKKVRSLNELYTKSQYDPKLNKFIGHDISVYFGNASEINQANGKTSFAHTKEVIRGVLLNSQLASEIDEIPENVVSSNKIFLSDSDMNKSEQEYRLIIAFMEWYKKEFSDQTKRIKCDIVGWVSRLSEYTRPWDYYFAQKIVRDSDKFRQAFSTAESRASEGKANPSLAVMNSISSDILMTFLGGFLLLHKNELKHATRIYKIEEAHYRRKFVYEYLGVCIYHLGPLLHFRYPKLMKYYCDLTDFKVPAAPTTAVIKSEKYMAGMISIKVMEQIEQVRLDVAEFNRHYYNNVDIGDQELLERHYNKLKFPKKITKALTVSKTKPESQPGGTIVKKVKDEAFEAIKRTQTGDKLDGTNGRIFVKVVSESEAAMPTLHEIKRVWRDYRLCFETDLLVLFGFGENFHVPRYYETLKSYNVNILSGFRIQLYLTKERDVSKYLKLKNIIGDEVVPGIFIERLQQKLTKRLLEVDVRASKKENSSQNEGKSKGDYKKRGKVKKKKLKKF